MRLDIYLTEKFKSRNKAGEAIKRGEVLYNGNLAKPSQEIKDYNLISFNEPDEYYVSNGGYKLSKAIKEFNISVSGLIGADIGASTGGFTDCLLKNGAKKIYAIDVGENLLNEDLKKDNRIIKIENTNARFLTKEIFEEALDFIVIDVSFISVKHILPRLSEIIKDGKFLIVLIKPQFECENKNINKNGIVTDSKTRKNILKNIIDYCIYLKLFPYGITFAPLKPDKNTEYLLYLKKGIACEFKTILDNLS